MNKTAKQEVWVIYTSGGNLCHSDGRAQIFLSKFNADIECLRCKWQARTLTGYFVKKIII